MSRLARKAIPLPKGVEVKAVGSASLQVKGPKGQLALELPEGLHLRVEGQEAYLDKRSDALSDALHGLHRALICNAVNGVSQGFEIRLTLIGVGYRAAVQGNKLDLQVGYSHPTQVSIPSTVQVAVDKGTAISIKGANRQEVGQFAAAVRAVKPPEPYKGKGIRYENEYVRKKEGKAAKAKGTA